MRRLSGWLFVVVVALSVASCGGPAPTQEFGKQDGDQIRQMIGDFTAAYNAKDVEKIGTFFAPSASLMPPNRATLRGVDSIKGFFKLRVTDEGGTDLAIEPQAVEGQGPLAYCVGTYTMKLQPADGTAPRSDRGKVVWIVRKLAGQWKFEWQIMASDLPPIVPPAQ
jgi:ketosteroid isomerase-like protein